MYWQAYHSIVVRPTKLFHILKNNKTLQTKMIFRCNITLKTTLMHFSHNNTVSEPWKLFEIRRVDFLVFETLSKLIYISYNSWYKEGYRKLLKHIIFLVFRYKYLRFSKTSLIIKQNFSVIYNNSIISEIQISQFC